MAVSSPVTHAPAQPWQEKAIRLHTLHGCRPIRTTTGFTFTNPETGTVHELTEVAPFAFTCSCPGGQFSTNGCFAMAWCRQLAHAEWERIGGDPLAVIV